MFLFITRQNKNRRGREQNAEHERVIQLLFVYSFFVRSKEKRRRSVEYFSIRSSSSLQFNVQFSSLHLPVHSYADIKIHPYVWVECWAYACIRLTRTSYIQLCSLYLRRLFDSYMMPANKIGSQYKQKMNNLEFSNKIDSKKKKKFQYLYCFFSIGLTTLLSNLFLSLFNSFSVSIKNTFS